MIQGKTIPRRRVLALGAALAVLRGVQRSAHGGGNGGVGGGFHDFGNAGGKTAR